ncbi:MAG: outer membrane lipoprotein-sorting protein [Verrucomicrobiota bacterium JB022]|nr:outer membrane lipoprotein-sorting protein [Verrucomicrobiota bacterium JB022]
MALTLLPLNAAAQRLLTDLDAVLAKYIEANGGQKEMDAVQSLRVIGKYTMEGKTFDLNILKRRPDLKVVSYAQEGVTITIGYDGQRVWRQIDSPQGRRVEPMEGPEAQEFIGGIDFDGPLVGKPGVGETRKLLEPERIGRVDYYRIELTKADGKRIVYYIDSRTMREAKNLEYTTSATGEETVKENFLSDYAQYDGIWLARKIEAVSDGERQSLLEVSNVQINPGIIRSYFSMPSPAVRKPASAK